MRLAVNLAELTAPQPREIPKALPETKLKCGKSRLLSVPRPGHRAAKAEIA